MRSIMKSFAAASFLILSGAVLANAAVAEKDRPLIKLFERDGKVWVQNDDPKRTAVVWVIYKTPGTNSRTEQGAYVYAGDECSFDVPLYEYSKGDLKKNRYWIDWQKSRFR